MKGITGRHKRYVEVIVDVAADGTIRPLTVVWDSGRTFPIDEVLDVRPASARKAEGTGMRYTVRVGKQATYLFREGERWFVEEKERAPIARAPHDCSHTQGGSS